MLRSSEFEDWVLELDPKTHLGEDIKVEKIQQRAKKKQSSIGTALGFLAPNITGFLAFVLIPVFASLFLVFTEWDILTPPKWVGFTNFIRLFSDPTFWQVLKNTLFYTVISIPLSMLLSFLLALFMNQKIKGITIYRTIYFIPVVSSMVAVSLMWRWIYNADFGLLNYFLGLLRIEPVSWLTDTRWAMPAIIMMSVWKGLGSGMVIFLAGLQGIPKQLYEAADIDGASGFYKVMKITIPLLTPTFFFVLITNIISSFQVFDQTYVLTQGGPMGSTTTIVYYIYKNAFEWFKMGYASAIAWVLFVFIFALTMLQWHLQGRWVHYE